MVEKFLLLFSLAPILRGFIAMIVSGAAFPLCGVMVLRLNLVPMRYMLMHGVILGGAVSLAMNLPVVPVSIVINLILIVVMMLFTKNSKFGFNGGSSAAMILSMAAASVIMHIADVPAKDTLSLLWGSPFALTNFDLYVLAALGILLGLYIIFNFKNIIALFFNREIAQSLGINVRFHCGVMVCVVALVVALAMKILGAFLIDSLLILPVLTSSVCEGKSSGGIKKLFVRSSIFGLLFSVAGYVLAVMINWPPAATISVVSGFVYILVLIVRKILK